MTALPKKPEKHLQTEKINLHLTKDELKHVNDMAWKRRVSRNAYLRALVIDDMIKNQN